MTEHEKSIKSNVNSAGILSNHIDKSIIEELIKCDLCNIMFDQNTHSPLVLKCGHTFCKKCISLKSNNIDKNVNRQCPLDKTKNVMNLENAIPNLKLEYIIKKIININLQNKKPIEYQNPKKVKVSPIKTIPNAVNIINTNNNSNNISTNVNSISNNTNNNTKVISKNINDNNINVIYNINPDILSGSNNNVSNINHINSNVILNNNITIHNINNINSKNNNIKKDNNIQIEAKNKAINTQIKHKNSINSLSQTNKSIPSNNLTNINTTDNKDILLNKAKVEPNKISVVETNIIPKEEEAPVDTDLLNPEIEKLNKVSNVTFCTVTDEDNESYKDDLIRKEMMAKKKNDEDEDLNSNDLKNLKKINLMSSQDLFNHINLNRNSLNICMMQPFNFSITPNTDFQSNDHNKNLNTDNYPHIITIYDKIQMKLRQEQEENNMIDNSNSNNNMIFNNKIIIATDNSSSLSQEKIYKNNEIVIVEQFNYISKKRKISNNNHDNNNTQNNNNNENNTHKIKQIPIPNNIQPLKRYSKEKDKNVNNNGDTKKNEKIGVNKHVHSKTGDFLDDNSKFVSKISYKQFKDELEENIKKENNLNNSYDSFSSSIMYKHLGPNNNNSVTFSKIEFEESEKTTEIIDDIKYITNRNQDNKKQKNSKASQAEIEKIKNNLITEGQYKTLTLKNNIENKVDIKDNQEIFDQRYNLMENHVLKEIKETNFNVLNNTQKKNNESNNNNMNLHSEIKIYKEDEFEKENQLNYDNNQNIKILNNTKITNIKKKISLTKPLPKKMSKDECFKKLKSDYDSLIAGKHFSIIKITNLSSSSSLNISSNISYLNSQVSSNPVVKSNSTIVIDIKKLQEEAIRKFFENQKYKVEWEKVRIKFFQNNDFFIGIFDNEDKYPKRGIMVTNNADYYEGDFVNGKREGEGMIIYSNGIKYEGFFVGGNPNGKGKLYDKEGDIYEGEFKGGKLNGHGIKIHKNGDKYIGNHTNNIRQGQGTYEFATGDVYKGNWVDGKANGKGKLTTKNGDIFEGEFKDNNFTKGTLTKNNGDIYMGEFKVGMINGYGTHINPQGEKFAGRFLAGKKNGSGKLYDKEGKLIKNGIWKNDEFMGNAVQISSQNGS